MSDWTDQQVMAIAARVLAEQDASPERKAWALDVIARGPSASEARARDLTPT